MPERSACTIFFCALRLMIFLAMVSVKKLCLDMAAANKVAVFGLLLFASFRHLYKSSNLIRIHILCNESGTVAFPVY